MKTLAMLGLILVCSIFLSGCQGMDLSKVSDEDIARISKNAVICESPYIRVGTGCCLDKESNKICDIDERTLTQEEKKAETTVNTPAQESTIKQAEVPSSQTPVTQQENNVVAPSKTNTPSPSTNCPVVESPPSGFCDGGRVMSGGLDTNGCMKPYTCAFDLSEDEPIEKLMEDRIRTYNEYIAMEPTDISYMVGELQKLYLGIKNDEQTTRCFKVKFTCKQPVTKTNSCSASGNNVVTKWISGQMENIEINPNSVKTINYQLDAKDGNLDSYIMKVEVMKGSSSCANEPQYMPITEKEFYMTIRGTLPPMNPSTHECNVGYLKITTKVPGGATFRCVLPTEIDYEGYGVKNGLKTCSGELVPYITTIEGNNVDYYVSCEEPNPEGVE